jgi:hypothetical protein
VDQTVETADELHQILVIQPLGLLQLRLGGVAQRGRKEGIGVTAQQVALVASGVFAEQQGHGASSIAFLNRCAAAA